MLPTEQSPRPDALTRIRRLRPPIWALRSSMLSRGCARGAGEVVYGAGKTADPVAAIIEALRDAGQERILVPHLDSEKAARTSGSSATASTWDMSWTHSSPSWAASPPHRQRAHRRRLRRHERLARRRGSRVDGRVLWQRSRPPLRCWRRRPAPPTRACRGTCPGAGGHCHRRHGGRAGKRYRRPGELSGHRRSPPAWAGASFGGVAALLAMLNSCASGVSVVNIDNGFGAAYQASLINHLSAGTPCAR